MAAEVVQFDRGLEPQRKVFRAEERGARRHNHYVLRISRAHTPGDKLNAAVDLLRAVANDPNIDQADRDSALIGMTSTLIAAAETLGKKIRRHR